MSKIGINVSIDVTKIDKSELFAGKKGTYLDMTVFIDDTADQYGNNGMVTQKADKGEKGAILGNCKVFWRDDAPSQPTAQPVQQAQPATADFDTEIPF